MVKMGLWLFHRKSHKRSRSGADLSDPNVNGTQSQAQQPSQTLDVQSKSKRQRTNTEPNKARRRNRNLSYSPGRQDLIRLASQRRKSREYPSPIPMTTATSTTPLHPHPYQSSTSQHRQRSQHAQTHASQRQKTQPLSDPGSRNGSQEWYRMPTLRNRPPSAQINRTKLSKRSLVDRDREAEIRAMTAQYYPTTEQSMSGRPMRKDSRRVRTTGGIFSPSSNISLPSAASIRSNMSTDSEHTAFRVSAINSLAPRPTLRYSSMHAHAHNNPYGPYGYAADGFLEGSGPLRSRSQRKRLAERPPIPEATLRAHTRIDELADDLTASDIRELMERDKRRRDHKRQREQERMARRLAHQAQKEHQQHLDQEAGEQSRGPNLERGVLGRELAGLGVSQPASAVLTSSRPRTSSEENVTRMNIDQEGTPHSNRESTSSSQLRPLEQFHRADSIHKGQEHVEYVVRHDVSEQHSQMLPAPPRESEWPATEPSGIIYEEEPSPAVAAAIAAGSGFPQRKPSISRRKSDRRVLTKKSRSKSPPLTHETQGIRPLVRQDDTSITHKSSETGGSGRASRLSWTAIFKWRGRNKGSSAGPSSFSNTSRDSMQAAHMTSVAAVASAATASESAASAVSSTPHPGSIPIAPNVTFIPPRRDGAPSTRRPAVSRFREHLPEAVVSPPQSRVQSPAAQDLEPVYQSGEPTPTRHPYTTSDREVDRATPTSIQTLELSSVDPSPEPQSMSLASIDSEGSWFGGRKRPRMARLDTNREPQHPERATSATSNNDNTEDEFGLADDDYLVGLSPPARQSLRISMGEACPSSDGGDAVDGEATWGTLPRTPAVHHEPHKMKSSEGLLNSYGDPKGADVDDDKEMRIDEEKEDSGIDTEPESPVGGDDTIGVHRATSVNLGRSHARHISAGSAKLLQLTQRSSVDGKRRSFEPPQSITQ